MLRFAAVSLVLSALLASPPAQAEQYVIVGGGTPDLSAPEPVRPAGVAPQAAPAAVHSHAGPATTAFGVAVGAGLMLAGTWSKTPRAARNLTRSGLAMMIVFPLIGFGIDSNEPDRPVRP